jgi:hypothetical protein
MNLSTTNSFPFFLFPSPSKDGFLTFETKAVPCNNSREKEQDELISYNTLWQ